MESNIHTKDLVSVELADVYIQEGYFEEKSTLQS